MNKNNTSMFPTNQDVTIPIFENMASSSKQISFTLRRKVEEYNGEVSIGYREWEEITPDPILFLTTYGINIEKTPYTIVKGMSWSTAMEMVLQNRANTWRELARL